MYIAMIVVVILIVAVLVVQRLEWKRNKPSWFEEAFRVGASQWIVENSYIRCPDDGFTRNNRIILPTYTLVCKDGTKLALSKRARFARNGCSSMEDASAGPMFRFKEMPPLFRINDQLANEVERPYFRALFEHINTKTRFNPT